MKYVGSKWAREALLISLAAVFVPLGLWVGQARAADPTSRVDTNLRVPLVVNKVVDAAYPKDLAVGTQVCATGQYTYASDSQRYLFQGWQIGATQVTDRCVTLAADQPRYLALFQEQELVQVVSALSEATSSQWVAVGAVVELHAPGTISGRDDQRWRFISWSAGLSPTSLTNQVVVTKPVTVEARYTAEYRIRVAAQGSGITSGDGWYSAGQLATVRTADTVTQGSGSRLRFSGWTADGMPASSLPQQTLPVLTFHVTGPATFTPKYAQEYLVTATGPQGVMSQGWQPADSMFTIETPASTDGLRFVQWREAGTTDSLTKTAKLQLVVGRPLRLEAVYEAVAIQGAAAGSSTLNSNAAVPLLVDGVEAKQLPLALTPGAKACVPNSLTYTAEGERYSFLGWSDGNKDLCRTVAPGATVAFFEKQILLRITTSIKSAEQIKWVTANTVVDLEAPAVVENSGVRWEFDRWTAGEKTSSNTTRLAVLKPLDVEAKFTPKYLVQVLPAGDVTPFGGGWYSPGETAVLHAPGLVQQTTSSRLKFVQWEQVGDHLSPLSGLQQSDVTVQVNGPLALRPRYSQEYLVDAENPQGVLSLTWVEQGKTVELETPAVVSVVDDQERLRFAHWEQQEANAQPLAQMPKLVLTVDHPMNLRAVYQREFKVTLSAPYGGSGTGWYAENSTAIISVPPQPQAVLFVKKVFQGYAGYPDTGPVLQIVAQAPLTVGAIYRNEMDFKVLVFLAAGLLVAFLIWRLTERATASKQETAIVPQPPQEEEIIEEVVEEEDDSHPPVPTGRQLPRDQEPPRNR